MRTLGSVLVALYAVLNLFLSVAGITQFEAPLFRKLLPCAVFLSAGLVLGQAAWRADLHWLMFGLVLGSIAPVMFGWLVEGTNVLLHHAVRGVFAVALLAVCWCGWRTARGGWG